MFDAKVLLIDTDVWIDYFLGSREAIDRITALFGMAADRGIALAYAPTSLKDVFYIIPRRLRAMAIAEGDAFDERSFLPVAWSCVRKITEIGVAAPQALAECELAWMLRGTHGDLEDNLVIAAAETCNADYVVTDDSEMLEHFSPACITPEQALRLLELP